MKTFFYLLLYIAPLLSFGQINDEYSYKGKTVVEWTYNHKNKNYSQVSKLPLVTKIILSETAIWFKKGENAIWLENTWFFDSKTRNSNGEEIMTYYDERNQKIELNLDNNKIIYYFDYNYKTKIYENYAVYLNLTLNENVLANFYEGHKSLNLEKVVVNFTKVKSNLEEEKDVEQRNSFILNYNKHFDVYHYMGKHNFEVYSALDFQETKNEEGDEVNKIMVKNKKGEKFYVIFFNDEIDVVAIEKKNELVFYTN